jgi:uncharacterized protein
MAPRITSGGYLWRKVEIASPLFCLVEVLWEGDMGRLLTSLAVLALSAAAAVADEAATRPPTDRLLQAAEADNAEAQFLLGMLHLSSDGAKQAAKGVEWLRRASARGHGGAKVLLARAYLRGTGVKADPVQALKLAEDAAAAGSPEGQILLARFEHEGIGTRRDDAAAAEWLQKAAAQDKPEAMVELGKLAFKGEGMAKDPAKAAELFKRAALLGSAAGAHNLGVSYLTGEGIPEDAGEAARWFGRAAEAGHPASQYDLGLLYLRGEGVGRDPVQAVKWLALAGSEPALRLRVDRTLKQLSDPLGAAVMAEGLAAAGAWSARPNASSP